MKLNRVKTANLNNIKKNNLPKFNAGEKVVIIGLSIALAIVLLIVVLVATKLLSMYPANPTQSVLFTPTQSATSTEQPSPIPASTTPAVLTPESSITVPPTETAVPPISTVMPLPFSEGPFTYGVSFGGRELWAYRLGTGPLARALIGGIHGGYEWNTVVLVSETLRYLQENPASVPDEVTLYIIPCANPDGYAAGIDREYGRMNGNNVDLNRNWDYHWQMTATHGIWPVYAGASPFSEPETVSLRDFIQERDIELIVFYHSAMGKIFSGAERDNCYTDELAEMMSRETGYPYDPVGVPGQITTGDAVDWLSKVGIAGIEIELTNHQDTDWEQNLRGVLAFLNWTIPGQVSVATPVFVEGQSGYMTYTVQSEETLLEIAYRYDVSVEELADINGITDMDTIYEGQELLIPIRTGGD